MEQILADIQSGKFADEFLADSKMVKNSLKNIVKQLLTIQSNQLVQNFATADCNLSKLEGKKLQF